MAQRAKKAAEKSAKKAAAEELRDGGEDVYLMEPMRISQENSADRNSLSWFSI